MRVISKKSYLVSDEQIQRGYIKPTVKKSGWKSYLLPAGALLATAGLIYSGVESEQLKQLTYETIESQRGNEGRIINEAFGL